MNDESFKLMKKPVDKSKSILVKKFKMKNESSLNPEAMAIMENYA